MILNKEKAKSYRIYICDVCGKKQRNNANMIICRFCKKEMLFSCDCYGDLSTPRACCGQEHEFTTMTEEWGKV